LNTTLSLLRTLRKEFTHQRARNPFVLRIGAGLALAVSAVSALVIWRDHQQAILRQSERQLRTDAGLVELRVNQHRTTVLDWGHWDTMYRYAGGQDPGFVQRELAPSSIVRDGQRLIVVEPSGRWLSQHPPQPLSQALVDCLNRRVQRLRQLSAAAASNKAFGLFCPAGQQVVLGAATGIRPSSGEGPERGSLIHLSAIERPSFGAALNGEFHRISTQLKSVPVARGATHLHHTSLSELHPAGGQWVLVQAQTPLQVSWLAVRQGLPAWLAINLALLVLGPSALLLSRQRRMPQRLRTLQTLRTQRRLQHQVGQLLLSRRQLLQALDAADSGEPCLLAAVRLCDDGVDGDPDQLRHRQVQSLQELTLALAADLEPRCLGRMDESTVLLLLPMRAPLTDALALESCLQGVLERIRCSPSVGAPLRFSAAITEPSSGAVAQQAVLLHRAVLTSPPSDRIARLEGLSVDSSSAAFTQEASSPGAQQWLDALPDGCYDACQVQEIRGETRRPLYTRLQFSLEKAAGDRGHLWTMAKWLKDAAGERLVDRYLLAQARAWLLQTQASGAVVAVRWSTATLVSEEAIAVLQRTLETWPPTLRQRLVIGLEEDGLMQIQGYRRPQLLALQELGVRVAIEGFGLGTAPIKAVYSLTPSVLRLSSEIGRRIQDENALAMVEFLLTLSRYKRCTVVMAGMDREDLLRYWLRKGVTAFEGLALTAQLPELITPGSG